MVLHSFLNIMIKSYKQKRINLKSKSKNQSRNQNEGNYLQRVSSTLSFINYEYDQ
jgi:hypothetical protein